MGSYKLEKRTITVGSAVADACAELTALAEEMREKADAIPENMQSTDKYTTTDDTASTLENVTEPDVPAALDEISVTYSEQVQKRKGRGTSRAVRCENACAMLSAAADALDDFMKECDEKDTDESGVHKDEADTLKGEIEEITGECDSLEFPGMYG